MSMAQWLCGLFLWPFWCSFFRIRCEAAFCHDRFCVHARQSSSQWPERFAGFIWPMDCRAATYWRSMPVRCGVGQQPVWRAQQCRSIGHVGCAPSDRSHKVCRLQLTPCPTRLVDWAVTFDQRLGSLGANLPLEPISVVSEALIADPKEGIARSPADLQGSLGFGCTELGMAELAVIGPSLSRLWRPLAVVQRHRNQKWSGTACPVPVVRHRSQSRRGG